MKTGRHDVKPDNLEVVAHYKRRNETMTYTIKNTEAPATKKQLFAIYRLTKKDMRGTKLTKGEASRMIAEALNTPAPKKEVKPAIVKAFDKYFDEEMLPAVVKVVKATLGIKSVVVEDTTAMRGTGANGAPKRFTFYGCGCSISYFKYRKGNKKAEAIEKAFRDKRAKLAELVGKELGAKVVARLASEGCPLGAILYQDYNINDSLYRRVVRFAHDKGVNMDYVTRLD